MQAVVDQINWNLRDETRVFARTCISNVYPLYILESNNV